MSATPQTGTQVFYFLNLIFFLVVVWRWQEAGSNFICFILKEIMLKESVLSIVH